MRFQRSIKIFPGLRLNLSKSGLGVSAGVRGLRLGIDSKGRSYVNAGIPGTGLSVRQYAKKQEVPHVAPPPLQLPHSQPIQHIKTMGTGLESAGTGTKVVWAVVGAGVLLIGALLTISQPNKKAPAEIVARMVQPHRHFPAHERPARRHHQPGRCRRTVSAAVGQLLAAERMSAPAVACTTTAGPGRRYMSEEGGSRYRGRAAHEFTKCRASSWNLINCNTSRRGLFGQQGSCPGRVLL